MGKQVNIHSMKNSMEDPKNISIELPYDLGIPLLGIFTKEIKLAC